MFVMYISEWRWNLGPKALHPTPQNGGRFAGVVEATGEQFNPRWRKDYGYGLIVTKNQPW